MGQRFPCDDSRLSILAKVNISLSATRSLAAPGKNTRKIKSKWHNHRRECVSTGPDIPERPSRLPGTTFAEGPARLRHSGSLPRPSSLRPWDDPARRIRPKQRDCVNLFHSQQWSRDSRCDSLESPKHSMLVLAVKLNGRRTLRAVENYLLRGIAKLIPDAANGVGQPGLARPIHLVAHIFHIDIHNVR